MLRWLRKPAPQAVRLVIDGDEVREWDVDAHLAVASTFKRVPGLKQSLMVEFREAMKALETASAEAKDHGELVRRATKAAELWRFLEIPRMAVGEANRLLELQKADQEAGPIETPAPQTVM